MFGSLFLFFKKLITSVLASVDHSFLFQRLLPILSRAKHEFSTVSGGFFSLDSIFHHCRDILDFLSNQNCLDLFLSKRGIKSLTDSIPKSPLFTILKWFEKLSLDDDETPLLKKNGVKLV